MDRLATDQRGSIVALPNKKVVSMEDQDIGLLWAEHYPRRKDEQESQMLCRNLCVLIKGKTVLAVPGIPGMIG